MINIYSKNTEELFRIHDELDRIQDPVQRLQWEHHINENTGEIERVLIPTLNRIYIIDYENSQLKVISFGGITER